MVYTVTIHLPVHFNIYMYMYLSNVVVVCLWVVTSFMISTVKHCGLIRFWPTHKLHYPFFVVVVEQSTDNTSLVPPHRKQTQTISRARWRTRSSPSSTRWCLWDGTCSCWWWRTATGRTTWQWRSWPASCATNRRWEVTLPSSWGQ